MYPVLYLQNTMHTPADINYTYVLIILHLPGVNGGSYEVDSHGKDIKWYGKYNHAMLTETFTW